jgi:uncharacterized membrane protein YjjB (DUF3815 family)
MIWPSIVQSCSVEVPAISTLLPGLASYRTLSSARAQTTTANKTQAAAAILASLAVFSNRICNRITRSLFHIPAVSDSRLFAFIRG